MNIQWKLRGIFFVAFLLGGISQNHALLTEGQVQSKKSLSFGFWVKYQQEFGALNDHFFTVGGPSFGFNLGANFFFGVALYTPMTSPELSPDSYYTFVYGGGIIGFRLNPNDPVVVRIQALIGAVGFNTVTKTTLGFSGEQTSSFIIVPEVALDIRVAKIFYISLGVSYRYIEGIPEVWKDLQGLGALSGNVSLMFMF